MLAITFTKHGGHYQTFNCSTKHLLCRRKMSRSLSRENVTSSTHLSWLYFRHYCVTVAGLFRRLSAVLILIPELQKYLLNLHTNARSYTASLALFFLCSSGGGNQVLFLLLREPKPLCLPVPPVKHPALPHRR